MFGTFSTELTFKSTDIQLKGIKNDVSKSREKTYGKTHTYTRQHPTAAKALFCL